MLSQADTDLLCRVGQGTPMGTLMRQYWLPAVYTWEIEPDGEPKRLRILGEDLLAWRDSAGRPGFIAANCPHRGASLFFGRNEERGLRCVYHGWKFDVDGACIDMPNEPAESNFKEKVKASAYRAAEAGGITWIYMGPRQADPPALPDFEWCSVPSDQRQHAQKIVYECNYMQALEGELDTTHVYFLHSRLNQDVSPGFGLHVADRRSHIEIVDTPYGVLYGARRQEDVEHYYWRSTHYLFPIYGMWPGGAEEGTVPLSIYLPVDDYHTVHWGLFWHPGKAIERASDRPGPAHLSDDGSLIPGVGPMKPHQQGRFFADWWPVANPENDFLMNPETRKSRNFTGIPTVRLQDSAMIHSMGPIMNRLQEHLGTADATVIRVRRRMLNAVKRLDTQGVVPPGVEHPEMYRVRSCQAILPLDQDWQSAMSDWHFARGTEHPTGGFQPLAAR